jgi:hypothetical protein
MLKKLVFLSMLFAGSLLFSQEMKGLSFYKETAHFQAFCKEPDQEATES